jgi:hypothetical protein
MSTILFSKGDLVTDSCFINNIGKTKFISQSKQNVKLVLSSCGCLAMAVSGRAFPKEDLVRVADQFVKMIKDENCIDPFNKELISVLGSVIAINQQDISAIVIENITQSAYNIETAYDEKHEVNIKVARINNDDTFSIGSGCYFAMAATVSGLNPIDALKFTIKKDCFTKGPIQIININDLNSVEGQ